MMNYANEITALKYGRFRIIFIGLILGFLFSSSSVYLAFRHIGRTKDQRLLYLKQAVQIARNSIEPVLDEYRKKKISTGTAYGRIRDVVRRMVYRDHSGNNYIFMSSYKGIMLVQPFEPEKEMTYVWDLKDANGVYIIRALVKAAKSPEGQGYVSYYYQRPGDSFPQEKISFVMGIPELGCYIGTGQYMDDIINSQFSYILKTFCLTFLLLALLFILVRASMKEINVQNIRLHRTERELTAIFNHTFQFMGTLSPEGVLQKVNHSALEFIGKSEEDVVGRLFWETPWWQGEEIKNRLKRAVHDSSHGKFCRFEGSNVNEKQEKVYVDVTLSPIFDEERNIVSILAEGRDISEQIKARDDLLREKKFFDYVIESLPGIFSLYKEEGGEFLMKKWNFDQHLQLLGYSPEDLKDAPIEMFVEKKDLPELKKILGQISKTGRACVQFNIKNREGRLIPVLYQARYFEHSGENYLVLIGVELTEKLKAEEERLKLESMLGQAQKMEAMGTLAGGIAHDFNNILSAVLGYAELAQVKLSPDDPVQKMIVQVISAANRAKKLVNQILLFSRQSELEVKPVRLDLIVREALKLLRSSIPSTIEFRQSIPVNSGTIVADSTQIHQVVMNLCTNAYYAMKDSGGILTVSLMEKEILQDGASRSEPSLSPGRYFVLEVSDTGHGMAPEVFGRIFDPYFTTKKKGEGTGLGLSVVHGIVKKCGGDVRVSSEPGLGTRFEVFFPVNEMEAESKEEEPGLVLRRGSERILLVEDDLMVLEMMEELLAGIGYEISAFSNSLDALEAFYTYPERFDMVITDMTMPKMTGFDLSGKILGIKPQVPIILYTGYSETVTREQAYAIGIRAFLQKPVSREVLAETIREVFETDKG